MCEVAGITYEPGLSPRTFDLMQLQEIKLGRWPSHANWKSKQIQELKIINRSPFKSSIIERLGPRASKFIVRWKYGDLFGFGVGLTYTDLVSPKYSAVAPEGSTKKVITKTGEDSMAGELAFFLNYRFLQHLKPTADSRNMFFKPGIELGAAINNDNPAVFLGFSLEIWRYARVGIGATWQEIEKLDGQNEGTPVNDDKSIKTMNYFENDLYFSFSFAIDSLSLFR
jgi:hypothetical protein